MTANSKSKRVQLALERVSKRRTRPPDPEEEADREADLFLNALRQGLKDLENK